MKELVKACFAEVSDPRVVGRCSHLLSDILMIGLCTYISGGPDYQDMYGIPNFTRIKVTSETLT